MKILLDTCLLLWIAEDSINLSNKAREIISNENNILYFSVVSLWEIVIKNSLEREDFNVPSSMLRRGLLDNGYLELNVHANHVLIVEQLPKLHKDPFDRLLIAQAITEGFMFLTSDKRLANYHPMIKTRNLNTIK